MSPRTLRSYVARRGNLFSAWTVLLISVQPVREPVRVPIHLDGTFSARVPTGHYLVYYTSRRAEQAARANPLVVAVLPGKTTDVTLLIDTGLPYHWSPEDTVVLVSRPASLVRFPKWIVPAAVRRTHAFHPVRVRLHVDERGRPSQATVLGRDDALARAAASAVSRSSWQPASRNGRPIASWDTLVVFETALSHERFVYYEDAPKLASSPRDLIATAHAGPEGTVRIAVLVGFDGSVWAAKVVRSVPRLDERALEIAWSTRWLPAASNSVPQTVGVEVPVTFRRARDHGR